MFFIPATTHEENITRRTMSSSDHGDEEEEEDENQIQSENEEDERNDVVEEKSVRRQDKNIDVSGDTRGINNAWMKTYFFLYRHYKCRSGSCSFRCDGV